MLGVDSSEARQWVDAVLPGLVAAGFVELSHLDFDAPEADSYRDVGGDEVPSLLEADEVWVPGRMSDGTVVVATLTQAGDQLLRALSPPEGLSMEGSTTFRPAT